MRTTMVAIFLQRPTVVLITNIPNIPYKPCLGHRMPRTGLFGQAVVRTVIGIHSDILGVSQDERVSLLPQVAVQSVVQLGLVTPALNWRQLIVPESLASAVGTDHTGLVVASPCL